ncbi:hypothetical protein LguiA_025544 [Lonicera macranthoides]
MLLTHTLCRAGHLPFVYALSLFVKSTSFGHSVRSFTMGTPIAIPMSTMGTPLYLMFLALCIINKLSHLLTC